MSSATDAGPQPQRRRVPYTRVCVRPAGFSHSQEYTTFAYQRAYVAPPGDTYGLWHTACNTHA